MMKGLYTKFLFLIIGLFSALGIALTTFIYVSENLQIEREGLTKAKMQERMAFESIYTSMQQGGGQEDINKVIERLRGLGPFTKLYFVRGEPVIRQFGMRRPETPSDEADSQALTGKEIQLVRGKDDYRLVRYVTPVAMQIECQNCHRARIGEILGVVSSEISLQELDRNLRQRRNLLALVIISGVFLLSLFIFLALKRMVILPLQKIKKGVKEIASGDLKATIPSLGQDEIGELGRGFEEMREKLARWGDELETKVKERTEALLGSEEAARRLAQENALVAEIGRIISSTPNIEEVFEHFSKAVAKLIPFDRIQINLGSLPEDDSYVRYVAGTDVPDRRAGEYVPLTGTATVECFRTKSSLLLQPKDGKEVEELGVRFPRLLPNLEAGMRSVILVPLIAKDQAIGVLSLRTTKTKAYTDQDMRLTESIASQIAGAVANAQLYIERTQAEEAARRSEEETRRLAKENAIIAEIGRIISSTLNIEEVYERFTQEVHKLIPIDRTAFTIINLEDRTSTTVYASGIIIAGRGAGEVRPMAGSVTEKTQQAKSGLIIKAEDENEVAACVPGFLAAFRAGIRSAMTIPLISRDQVIGVLHLHSIKSNAYTEKELKLAERISSQIAGAIANAQLFAERKRAEEAREKLVRELQKALSEVKTLKGIFPICASCKKIRDDKGYWNQVEVYIRDRSEAEFSHGICPECMKRLYPEFCKEDK